mmetsp:Transcript_11160/g.27080  ORF Transcript_11160/g.27080 Transcript_11160/m.27080 type:complete len:327 (+) Transcript_11160:696-1676(+)
MRAFSRAAVSDAPSCPFSSWSWLTRAERSRADRSACPARCESASPPAAAPCASWSWFLRPSTSLDSAWRVEVNTAASCCPALRCRPASSCSCCTCSPRSCAARSRAASVAPAASTAWACCERRAWRSWIMPGWLGSALGAASEVWSFARRSVSVAPARCICCSSIWMRCCCRAPSAPLLSAPFSLSLSLPTSFSISVRSAPTVCLSSSNVFVTSTSFPACWLRAAACPACRASMSCRRRCMSCTCSSARARSDASVCACWATPSRSAILAFCDRMNSAWFSTRVRRSRSRDSFCASSFSLELLRATASSSRRSITCFSYPCFSCAT